MIKFEENFGLFLYMFWNNNNNKKLYEMKYKKLAKYEKLNIFNVFFFKKKIEVKTS